MVISSVSMPARLPPPERRRALLHEGHDRLLEVFSATGFALEISFELELRGEIVVDRLRQRLLDPAIGERRPGEKGLTKPATSAAKVASSKTL